MGDTNPQTVSFRVIKFTHPGAHIKHYRALFQAPGGLNKLSRKTFRTNRSAWSYAARVVFTWRNLYKQLKEAQNASS